MHSPKWSDDNELMGDLCAALRPAPVEQRVIDAATAAFAWRTFDAEVELAELLYDSYVGAGALVRGPSSSAPRFLVFGRGQLRVEIELDDDGIEGQFVPPEPGVIRLLTISGCVAETTADRIGCFRFPTRRGPVRLTCALAGSRFATGWINA